MPRHRHLATDLKMRVGRYESDAVADNQHAEHATKRPHGPSSPNNPFTLRAERRMSGAAHVTRSIHVERALDEYFVKFKVRSAVSREHGRCAWTAFLRHKRERHACSCAEA